MSLPLKAAAGPAAAAGQEESNNSSMLASELWVKGVFVTTVIIIPVKRPGCLRALASRTLPQHHALRN
jgi:hypothetical protein